MIYFFLKLNKTDPVKWNNLIIQDSGCLSLVPESIVVLAPEFYIPLFMWTFIPREPLFQRGFPTITRVKTANRNTTAFVSCLTFTKCLHIYHLVHFNKMDQKSVSRDNYAAWLGI